MMNRSISILLAVACFTLAFALFWSGKQSATKRTGNTSPLEIAHAPSSDDDLLLERRVGDLKLDNVTLEDAIAALSERTKVNVVADWTIVESFGVSRQAHVRAHFLNFTLGQALKILINSLPPAAQTNSVAWYAADNIVTLTSSEEVSRHLPTRFYNVRPLVNEIIQSIFAPAFQEDQTHLFSSGPAAAKDRMVTRQEIVDQIVKLLTDTVASDSWRDAGGSIGSLREVGGVLVITQTPENHRATRDLLDQLQGAIHRRDDFPPTVRPRVAKRSLKTGPPSTQPSTECFNIRSLVTELQRENGWRRSPDHDHLATTPAEVIEDIIKLLLETIEPNSWRETGGTVGKVNEVGGVLAITQTPANLEAVRRALEALHRAANSPGFPSTRPVTTQPAQDTTIHSTTLDVPRVTEFVNLRPLIEELRIGSGWNVATRPDQFVQTPAEIIKDITEMVMEIIEPETWWDNGGAVGSLREVGGVLAITHTPANVRAVQNLLTALHRATSANDFAPATRPAAATTRSASTGVADPIPDRFGTTTACFNIRTMMIALGAGKPTYTPMGNDRGLATANAEWLISDDITTHVAPNSWVVNGGTLGHLREVGGILVVTNTPENLIQVPAALADLSRRIADHQFPPPAKRIDATTKSSGLR